MRRGSQGSAWIGTHWGTGLSAAQRCSLPQGISATPPSSAQVTTLFCSQRGVSGQPSSSFSPKQPAVANRAAIVTIRAMNDAPKLNAPRLIDSHAHLDFDKFADDFDDVLARAAEAGVEMIVTIGTDLPSSRRARDLAHRFSHLYASAGVHPHEADKFDDADWPALRALWDDPRVRGVGETGLDYYYDFSDRARQQVLFRRHLEVAGEVGRPVVVHVRDAYDDAFRIAEEVGLPAGGVLHCFTGGPAEAERALALGFHVSFSGIVTFKNAEENRQALPLVPDDRLLVETDSPFLAPIPKRGKRNEPAFVVHTARFVAEQRGIDYAALCALTRANTIRLFGLPEG